MAILVTFTFPVPVRVPIPLITTPAVGAMVAPELIVRVEEAEKFVFAVTKIPAAMVSLLKEVAELPPIVFGVVRFKVTVLVPAENVPLFVKFPPMVMLLTEVFNVTPDEISKLPVNVVAPVSNFVAAELFTVKL